jgi:hypothetical protein
MTQRRRSAAETCVGEATTRGLSTAPVHALTYSDGVVESDGDGSPIAHICNTLRRLEFGKGKARTPARASIQLRRIPVYAKLPTPLGVARGDACNRIRLWPDQEAHPVPGLSSAVH